VKTDALKRLVFGPFFGNVGLIAFYWMSRGFGSYLVISTMVTIGWLGFILLVLSKGYVFGRSGMVISREDSPAKFNANMIFLFVGYALVVLLSYGLYRQTAR
jgi:hypothetical protein